MASGADSAYSNLYLDNLRARLLETNGPLFYFYNLMFGGSYSIHDGGSLNNCSFHPSISGYTLIFMKAPHLSGYTEYGQGDILSDVLKMTCFIAIDFTPPPIQVAASELPSRSGSLPYAMEVSSTGQLSISYLDDQYEHCFGFHKVWTSYIEDVTRGAKTSDGSKVTPAAEYYTPGSQKFGEIDYMTSAFVVKFKPTVGTNMPGDIVYVGKATGIFPLNVPDKEVIGRRDSPELVTLTYNYPCAAYKQWAAGTPNADNDKYIQDEFLQDVASFYNGYSGSLSPATYET